MAKIICLKYYLELGFFRKYTFINDWFQKIRIWHYYCNYSSKKCPKYPRNVQFEIYWNLFLKFFNAFFKIYANYWIFLIFQMTEWQSLELEFTHSYSKYCTLHTAKCKWNLTVKLIVWIQFQVPEKKNYINLRH